MYSGVLLCYFLPKFPIYNHAKIQNRKPYLKLFIQIQKGLQTTGAICETNQTCLTYQFTKACIFLANIFNEKIQIYNQYFLFTSFQKKKTKILHQIDFGASHSKTTIAVGMHFFCSLYNKTKQSHNQILDVLDAEFVSYNSSVKLIEASDGIKMTSSKLRDNVEC